MARSRRSSAPARKPAPAAKAAPVPAKPAAPAPAPVQASTPAPTVGGGLLSTVAEGFAFGTGSAIARHGVNAVIDSFSGSKEEPAAQPVAAAAAPAVPVAASSAAVCASDNKAFLDCINRNANDVAACQFYLDALNQCKQQSINL
ncbi:elongation factor 2 [Phytophthora cinnamomi]|uniref:elongation factor 2 n=1 Tax=Phytophthora cinnamomi TaxID=4785 RepID=UPI00355A3FB9|nr:elongation factor 2 [Phytophthora cinnamomi]